MLACSGLTSYHAVTTAMPTIEAATKYKSMKEVVLNTIVLPENRFRFSHAAHANGWL